MSLYKDKPYIIIEYIEGEHGKNPNDVFDRRDFSGVAKSVAQLHMFTKDYQPEYYKDREIFDSAYCWREFGSRHSHLVESERGRWLKSELDRLEFSESLPKALCHADLNYGNFLFRDGQIVAVLDFDMSFYWYVIYDIASLIYWWAWPPRVGFKQGEARQIVSEYSKWRELNEEEKGHIYDALKLIVLLGIAWSEEDDFDAERKKIELLNSVGRSDFAKLLLNHS